MSFAISVTLTVAIAVLSLLRGEAWIVRITPRPLQKLLHIGFYAALAISLLTTQSSVGMELRIALPLILIGSIAFAALVQALQTFRPGRFARISDVALDAGGVVLGAAIWWVARP